MLFEVEDILRTAGLELDASSNRALAGSLAAAAAAAPESASLVRALATRSMSEAQYFSTGAQMSACAHSKGLQPRKATTRLRQTQAT